MVRVHRQRMEWTAKNNWKQNLLIVLGPTTEQQEL